MRVTIGRGHNAPGRPPLAASSGVTVTSDVADFTSVDAKVQRAEQHISDLQRAVREFVQSNPYEAVVQDDPDDAECQQMILRIHRAIPIEIPLITGDAVHTLRTALDHLVCVAVEANGGTVTNQTAFPVWRSPRTPTADEYRGLVLRKAKGAAQALIDLLLGLQPYEGGNHEALWALDYLDARDKHRLLLEALASHKHLILDFGSVFGPEVAAELEPGALAIGFVPADRFPLEDGHVLFKGPPEQMQNMKPQAAIEIALGEPGPLKGKAALPELTNLVQFTASVIDSLRAVI